MQILQTIPRHAWPLLPRVRATRQGIQKRRYRVLPDDSGDLLGSLRDCVSVMTNEQRSIQEWMNQFRQETPASPAIPSLEVRRLRAKIVLEEALELIMALGIGSISDDFGCVIDLEEVAIALKRPDCVLNEDMLPNLILIADGCADLRVVTVGTEVACGIDGERTMDEVMRSNFTKLWSENDLRVADRTSTIIFVRAPRSGDKNERKWLVKDKDGKVIKSPSYSPPEIHLCLQEKS